MYAFGATDFDARGLLRAAMAGRDDERQRPGHTQYDALGYIPAGTKGVWGSAATTLEYAVSDYALAQLAHRLGDTAAYDTLLKASGNWRNLLQTRHRLPPAARGRRHLAGLHPRADEGVRRGRRRPVHLDGPARPTPASSP